MSEVIDQESYWRITAMNNPYAIARELTEQTRIQSMSESIPRGEEVAGYCNGSLTWETHYLKPDYFLALFYDDT
ncbi:unnamed protein product, partial [marine sediment metagenome]